MSDETPKITFAELLIEQNGIPYPIDDILFLMLPLLKEVAMLHANGLVVEISSHEIVKGTMGHLELIHSIGKSPQKNLERIAELQPNPRSALNIVGESKITRDSAFGTDVDNLQVYLDDQEQFTHPVYLLNFQSWEIKSGHHDEITDIFQLGQILACLACGLNFEDAVDLESFADHRQNLFQIQPRINPILANVISEMTELNRYKRATDLVSIIKRIETWRDQPVDVNFEQALAAVNGVTSRRTVVLEHLRDRLFDLSRRNRLLHFKPTNTSINLTVASVPMVLHFESIKSDDLCIWDSKFADQVLSGKAIGMQRWLRFEDQPYLPTSLDRIIQDTRRDKAEFGFSNLRLVIAFLRWHNLKDAPDEAILSPLLWLPVQLVKKKGVRDEYMLQADEVDAEFNPVLRHQLRQLYDIKLPEIVDLEKVTLAAIHADIVAQIHLSEPGVVLELQTKPAIELIHQKAVQRLQQYQRKRGRLGGSRTSVRPDFSYEQDDYRPLGYELFKHKILPSPSPLRAAIETKPQATSHHPNIVETPNAAERMTYAHSKNEGNRYLWNMDLTQVTLANFNYKKMSLVRDYSQLIDEPTPNPTFDRMFSIEPRDIEVDIPASIPLANQWNVVTSDGTQNAAISLARTGKNFIIQGPPGTGKSQTITNLIADYAGQGLRVLFVCEKRAALDVVFHRLQQSGLDDLCCLIHDSQTDKKAFIADLKECYERWVTISHQSEDLIIKRDLMIKEITEQLSSISQLEKAMTETPSELGESIRTLLRKIIELPQIELNEDKQFLEQLPDWSIWQTNLDLTSRLYARFNERFGVKSLAEHSFSKLSKGILNSEHVYGDVKNFLNHASNLIDQVERHLDEPGSLLKSEMNFHEALNLSTLASEIFHFNLSDQLSLLEPTSNETAKLLSERQRLRTFKDTLFAAAEKNGNWKERFSYVDTQAALIQQREFDASVLRWFKPSWWKLQSQLKARYDFSKHAVRPQASFLLINLEEEYKAQLAFKDAEDNIKVSYGVTNLSAFIEAQEKLTNLLPKYQVLSDWIQAVQKYPNPKEITRRESVNAERLKELDSFLQNACDFPAKTKLSEASEFLRDILESLDDLPDMVPLLREFHQQERSYTDALRSHSAPIKEFETLIAHEALQRRLRINPELARFDGSALSQAVQRVMQAERSLLKLNSGVVASTLHKIFLDHLKLSSLSVTQLDNEQKLFKKNYSKGRRDLEHEFGKSMRFRSIRELSSGDTGLVVNDLKPIWLMSPLSVSDTLPLVTNLFDVVIFDEASQIPSEEAVPALSRANQVVVVGDEMQLPPTTFFASNSMDGQDEEIESDDGEKIAINLDADSLLSQAARNLPATLLAWHYRSRHEALISFSNAAFYDGRLITIPDRLIEKNTELLPPLMSTSAESSLVGVNTIINKPISFLKIVDGVYEDRSNIAEARFIALMVRDLLIRKTGMSFGIVAFSEAQQTQIESALEALSAEDSNFSTLVEQEYIKEENGQFNGLFIKNLENVQGDERDVIILSICYAPGPTGKMLMNFGPINQRGGEKRLNVIFSRARHRMAIVTSIHADAITNIHNDGASALKSFLQFAEANSHGESERSQTILSSLNPGAQLSFSTKVPQDSLRTSIATALRLRGHTVHENIGRSQFRCDLGLLDETGEGYSIGILLDPNTNTETEIRERYVFRPTVLRSFGWKVIDVLSLEWHRNPEEVLSRIEKALIDSGDQQSSHSQPQDIPEDREDKPTNQIEAQKEVPISKIEMRNLVFEEGSSKKFWRIGRERTDITIEFGRVGTKGQKLIKTFDTDERAIREVTKLVEEKLRKGYQDTFI